MKLVTTSVLVVSILTCTAGQEGRSQQAIPGGVLRDEASGEKLTRDQLTGNKTPAPVKTVAPDRSVFSDSLYGPALGLALRLPGGESYDVFRGIVARLDESGDACMVFDADTMRMAAGWTRGGLLLSGPPFTDWVYQEQLAPSFNGECVFQVRNAPGWSSGDDSLREPRTGSGAPPLGPLPREWAKFRGWYLRGQQVVFSYSVGGAAVLESPRLVADQDVRVLCRCFQIKGDGRARRLVVATINASTADVSDNIAVFAGTVACINGAPDDTRFEVVDDQLTLALPAFQGTHRFQLLLCNSAPASEAPAIISLAGPAPDLTPMTQGGPTRWNRGPLVTHGELAEETDQAYVVDRLMLPYNNPYGGQMRVGGFDFFADGKSAALSTWSGEVWTVSGINDTLERLVWKKFAAGLQQPLGLKIVDGVIYTVGDDQITRFHDFNQDGEADFYETFNNDWDLTSWYFQFCFDLHTDRDGNFYFGISSPVRMDGNSFERMGRQHGSIIRVSRDGSRLQRYATGLRAPNGMAVGPDDQVTCGDNEGTFVPRCPIHWVDQDEFLGVVDSAARRDEMKTTPTVAELRGDRPQYLDPSEMPLPLVWLPMSVDNSNGGQVWVTSQRWGPLQGEMLHMTYGQSALYLVLKEQRGSLMQGGVVRFPLRFTSSAMRARFSPRDGQLYVSGLRGPQTNAAKNGGFDRIRFTGQPIYMPVGLSARKNGIVITFSQPLAERLAADPDSYAVQAADILWTSAYGSREYQIGHRDMKSPPQGWTEMVVKDAQLMPDGRTVFVEIKGMQPVHQMQIDIDIEAADGTPLRTTIWNTVHVTE